jgi:hypothetical protein
MAGGGGGTAAGLDAALHRRQALMGASGPRALIKNAKVFSIALFACLGGLLYGYNQGMFSGILAMPSFGKRTFYIPPTLNHSFLLHSHFHFHALTVVGQ